MSTYRLQLTSTHHERTAELGEKVSFFASLVLDPGCRPVFDGEVRYKLVKNGGEVVDSGTYNSGSYTAAVRFSSDEPSFFRCMFEGYRGGEKVAEAAIGAIVAPGLLRPSLPVPEDFDAFWRAEIEELGKIPANVRMTEVERCDSICVYDVQGDCVGGQGVSGILARPSAPGKYPAILQLHGAGVRTSSAGRQLYLAEKGFLTLAVNAHGLENGHSPEWYIAEEQRWLSGYSRRGFDTGDPTQVYMKNMFLRVVRAGEILKSMPEWDGKNLWVFGGSQGAWQSLVGGALLPGVTGVAVWIPAGCDMYGGGWPFADLTHVKEKNPNYLKTMPYFDGCSMASRIGDIPVHFEVGLTDTTCKADGIMAAYNMLRSTQKEVVFHFQMTHETLESTVTALDRFIMSHLK